jgi:pSer/pThr/pTyr-binding forkhead associated (FHA) protein
MREDPFVLGTDISDTDRGLSLTGATAGISRSHCSLFRAGDDIVVEDHSTHGSFVNDRPVRGRTVLATGDRLRLGAPGIELRLIAVARDDGTSRD